MYSEHDTSTLSVFMPAYNAGNHIESVIERVPPDVWPTIRSFWIIDDGSTDDTRTVIESLKKRIDSIKHVSFEENKGYGSAVKTGLARCSGDKSDFVVCLHADGQYPPESIPAFLQTMRDQELDVLQGSRHASGTAISGGMPLYKVIAGKVLTFFENKVFGLAMSDYHSGFIMYSRRALETVPFAQLSPSFDIDLEIIASANARGLKISELPIPTRYADEESHLNPIRYGLRVVGVMVRYLFGGYR